MMVNLTAFPPFPQTGFVPELLPNVAIPGVQLWRATLNQPPAALPRLSAWLSDDERQGFTRILNPTNRRRALAARALLRWTLAHFVHQEPDSFVFATGEHGRPFLKGGGIPTLRDCNISHSGDHLLIGILTTDSPFARIGVDLERSDRRRDYVGLAERVLNPNERDDLASLTDETAYRLQFLRYWTLKEAFAKATGDGFTIGFERIDFAPDGQPRALPAPHNLADWHFEPIAFGEGTVASFGLWMQESGIR